MNTQQSNIEKLRSICKKANISTLVIMYVEAKCITVKAIVSYAIDELVGEDMADELLSTLKS